MSNQSENGFQGSQPFITDNEYKSLSLDQLRYILNQKKKTIQKSYKELSEKEKIIRDIRKLDKLNEKVNQGIDIKKKYKKKKAPVKKKTLSKKIKTFDEYFQECIKNKEIPKDTPQYFKEALERAMLEYNQGLLKEKSALSGFANKYVIEGMTGLKPMLFFKEVEDTLLDFLTYHKNIKFRLILVGIIEKTSYNKDGIRSIETVKGYFNSDTLENLRSNNEEELLERCIESIMAKIEAYSKDGSEWIFKEVEKLETHTVEFNPTKGSSYIPLPDWIKHKGAIVNIQNKDDKCFLWCILRYLHPRDSDKERIADLKKYEFSLNTKDITFPMKVNNINKFEKLNPEIPGINVFSVNDKDEIYPLKMAKKDCKNTIDLFLIKEDGKSHYTLINNFHRLIRSQKTKSKDGKIFICKRCFTHYTKEELLEKHIKYCSNNQTVAVKMPEPNTMLCFKNYYKQLPIPFVVYADFECFTKPMNTCSPNPKESYNYNYQKHEPSGFCFYAKGIIPGIHIKPIIYTKTSEDEDVAKVFVEKLTELTKGIYNDFYLRPKPLRLTRAEQKSFEEATICHICSKKLEKDKVRDHCHFTGKYRGAAHNKCNLECRKPKVLPVIFHNLQGYDAHLFIKQLAKLEGKLTCIPSTEEKYISFSKHIKVGEYKDVGGNVFPVTFEIRFLDSFKFLQTSLANLVSNLSPNDFHDTKYIFRSNTSLLTRKGVFPYDYVSSLNKLSETQLPPKEEFYSKLNDEDITDEDYQHAINVWNTFGCKTLRDYHNLYLKSDVLLLADVFENFRKTCLHHYKLDPAHYYTSPGLAWDACLKTTGQHLELLSDYDMLMMFERGIRGGITHISKRYAEANNKYMKNYDTKKESTFIQYLDANNLYGWAMSQNLPTHGFSWMKNITKEKVMDILEKANHSMSNFGRKGYIFEVDLEYPQHLLDKHNDYPLAPEKIKVNGVEKLISHFKTRIHYVIHYNTEEYHFINLLGWNHISEKILNLE